MQILGKIRLVFVIADTPMYLAGLVQKNPGVSEKIIKLLLLCGNAELMEKYLNGIPELRDCSYTTYRICDYFDILGIVDFLPEISISPKFLSDYVLKYCSDEDIPTFLRMFSENPNISSLFEYCFDGPKKDNERLPLITFVIIAAKSDTSAEVTQYLFKQYQKTEKTYIKTKILSIINTAVKLYTRRLFFRGYLQTIGFLCDFARYHPQILLYYMSRISRDELLRSFTIKIISDIFTHHSDNSNVLGNIRRELMKNLPPEILFTNYPVVFSRKYLLRCISGVNSNTITTEILLFLIKSGDNEVVDNDGYMRCEHLTYNNPELFYEYIRDKERYINRLLSQMNFHNVHKVMKLFDSDKIISCDMTDGIQECIYSGLIRLMFYKATDVEWILRFCRKYRIDWNKFTDKMFAGEESVIGTICKIVKLDRAFREDAKSE